MITFTHAPELAVGDKVSSVTRNTLSAAFNDRMRSGVGDWTFRMWFKALNLVRVIRNPIPPAYASKLDFLESYIHVPRDAGGWPASAGEAGLEGGANVVNPLMGFVHGVEALNVFNETGRLQGDEGSEFPVSFPTTPLGIWELGKFQRGALSADGTVSNAPALLAARAHRGLYSFAAASQPFDAGINTALTTSAFLKKYGGVLPRPVPTELCVNDRYSFTYNFTPIRAGLAAKSYVVVCGGSVSSIAHFEDHYLITLANGTTERLEKRDYIHGPFTGGQQLEHRTGTMLDEAVGEYCATFQGTDSERARDDGYGIRDVAFDFQSFLERQYLLAPAQATVSGASLDADYPEFYWEEGEDAAVGGFQNADGFVFAGVLITASTASARVVTIRSDDTGQNLYTFSIAAGSVSRIEWIPAPKNVGVIVARIDTPLSSGESVRVECAFLQERKPELCDAYLMLRLALGAARTGAEISARDVASDVVASGCLRSVQPLEEIDYANECPVVEAVRKQYRENLRLATRRQVRGYAVENGKSVLWFTRHVNVGGQLFDAWDGLAPGLDPVASGSLLGGVQYKVTGGSVVHNGVTVADGETFTAAVGVKDFTGEGEVRQVNGILASAPPNGLSNEWMMFVGLNCYNDSESSDYKPEAYSDSIVGLINRCKFFANPAVSDMTSDLTNHVGSVAAPECASAFNYWRGSNELANMTGPNEASKNVARGRFFKSCQVYAPDYEAESAVMDGAEVKLTFKTRFRTAEGAPAGDIARDSEDAAALGAETFRSDENGVREYLLHARGGPNCSVKLGDGGAAINVTTYGVYGACHPKFWFTRLMPKVFEDAGGDNDTQDGLDTRAFSAPMRWMAWALDAGCEGFIDPSVGYGGCPALPPANYTSEALFYQTASGVSSVVAYDPNTGIFDESGGGTFTLQGRSSEEDEWQFIAQIASPHPYTGLPSVRLLHTPAATPDRWLNTLTSAVRSDKMEWFGPLPNSKCYAGTFNQLARAVNLLVSAPAYIPAAIERRRVTYDVARAEPNVTGGNGSTSCNAANFNPVLVGAGVLSLVSMNLEPKSHLVSTGPWLTSDGTFAAQSTGALAMGEANGNVGALRQCVNGTARYVVTGTLAYDEMRIRPNVTQEVIAAHLHDNIVDDEPVYTATVQRRDITYRISTNPADPQFLCGIFDSNKRIRQTVQDRSECRRMTFTDGLFSTERFLRDLSPTSNTQPVPISDSLGYFVRFDTNCVVGPSSSVSVGLNGYPFVMLTFPLA